MKPVNSKSLFHHLCITLEKLDNSEIDVAKANATANVISKATNLLNYELKRAQLMSNEEFKKAHRNIECKTFDCIKEE